MKNKKTPLIIIGIIVIIIPVLTFVFVFINNPISDKQSDWADFGTYINGILTPIVSIFSFLILIYIYFEIEKLSNENNHNLFILQKRMEAFEELEKYIHEFSQINLRFLQIKNTLTSTLFNDKSKLNENTMKDFRDLSSSCSSLYHYTFFFQDVIIIFFKIARFLKITKTS
ncbi:hypothetical protein OEG92_08340 [Polaribacter sejongensis]|uniref:hypothetical protein n=1 Tax=Polaribacter sejongensis TaxID=985043 RepID=UPI0035A68CC5